MDKQQIKTVQFLNRDFLRASIEIQNKIKHMKLTSNIEKIRCNLLK